MVHPNLLIDALDALGDCRTDSERWACGTALFARAGSDWLTAGTAPRRATNAVAVRSSTPDILMRDYVGERIHLDDPWMRHCASSTAVDACDVRHGSAPRPTKARARMARLFSDHGIHRAILLPCYGGSRPGGLVLYARDADAADWLASAGGLDDVRLLAAVFAAQYRPEEDAPSDPQRYTFHGPLTARERDVLLWLAAGLRTAMIAQRMGVEPVTVTKHLQGARRKLGARTREQALAIAVRDRLIAI